MRVPISSGQRERPTRAVAPKNMTISDSEEEGEKPLTSPSTADAAALWTPDRGDHASSKAKSDDLSSGSDSTSTATKSSSLAMEFCNKNIPMNKRNSIESQGGSPLKKLRRITLKTKTNKSGGAKVIETTNTNSDTMPTLNQVATPAPSHAGPSTQLSVDEAAHFETARVSLNAIHSSLISARQAAKAAEELEQAKKTIALLEQQLKEAQRPKDSQPKPSPSEVASSHSFRDETGLRVQNMHLQNLYDDLKERHGNLRLSLAKELQEKKDSRPNSSFKVLDDEAEKEWREIGYLIRKFVLEILTVKPYGKAAPSGANHQEVKKLKVIQKKNPEEERFYFQQYIWKCLVTDVFHAGKNTWGGTVGQAFHRFCSAISLVDFEGMEELSRIKAYTADLLNRFSTQDNCNEAKEIARVMKRTLCIFMDVNRVEESGNLLFNIVRKAVELNAKFLRSKAFFVINWVPVEFDWEDLDIYYIKGERDVEPKLDIEISPTLAKIGSGDGRHFDSDKAMVICKPMVTVVKK
ncbi:hypothetical protein ACHAPU_006814 [Fusarium lateritium]